MRRCVVWSSVIPIPICPNHFWLADPTLFSILERVLGVSSIPPHSNTSERPVTTKGMRIILMIEEVNLIIAVHCNKRQDYLIFLSFRLKGNCIIFDNPIFDYHCLVVLVYCSNIHILCSLRLIKCPWLGRQISISAAVQSTSFSAHPWYPSHRTNHLARCKKDTLETEI